MGTIPRIAPSLRHDRAVVQTVADGDRRAHDHQLRPAGRCAGDLANGPAGALQEHGLPEEVGAGVARDAKLGKDDQIAVGGKAQQAADFGRVGRGVGDRYPGRGAGDADKAMSVHLGASSAGIPPGVFMSVATATGPNSFFRSRARSPARSRRQIDRASASRVEQGATCINGLAELDREVPCPG